MYKKCATVKVIMMTYLDCEYYHFIIILSMYTDGVLCVGFDMNRFVDA